MKDFSDRLSSLTPEQKALFESRLKKKTAARPKSPSQRSGTIPKRKRRNHCPLSFDQERIWIIDRMEPGNPAYNIYTASRLLGPLNIDAMERAVNEIIRRHEILRTTFSTVDVEPVMVIAPEWTLKMAFEDVSGVQAGERLSRAIRVVNEATGAPFDLEKGPLLRVGVIKLDDRDHVLHVTMHHTITDRWSAAVLEQEMTAIYAAFIQNRPSPLPSIEIQFADFAEWQREYLRGDVLAAKVDYWKNQLIGAPLVLDVPTDRPRPPFQKFRGAREIINLPESLLKGLKSFTKGEGATMFMTLLAAYNLLLYRYTGQEDILVGLAMANRDRPETENMLGYLLNMVIIRAKFSARTSFRELLEIVRRSAVGAFAHLDLPLGNLIEELKPSPDPSRNPIFQLAYIYLDFPPETGMESLNVKSEALEADNGSSRFDMTLALTEQPDHLETQFEYNTDIFDADTIKRMLQHLRVLLEGLVLYADRAISELPMLTSAEARQLQEVWNDTAAVFPRDTSVHKLAELVVSQSPDSIAVEAGAGRVTYNALNSKANKLANYLMTLGVTAHSRVAVCLDRAPELIVALLAVLKTGAAYVPVDPGYPIERIAHMLEDSGCHVVISQDSLIDSLPSHWGFTVSIDGDLEAIEEQSSEYPLSESFAELTAYIIYTSGSTGGPRGVAVPHRAINRLVLNSNYVDLGPDSVIAQCSNASFDAATFEIWGALLNGGRLVIIDKDIALSPREFADELRSRSITTMFLTTALFNEVARYSPDAFRSLEYLLFGGEAVTPAWVTAVLEAGGPKHLLHVYGPTESTTFSSFFSVQPVSVGETVPIGLAISNTYVHALDRNLNPVPAGVFGELLIAGEGLAHGYLNRPELTADRFIPDPFAKSEGERLYRSGDLVRRRPDGNIIFVGRNDFQVKIRGFRIELEEVESIVKRHPAISDAVVAITGGSENERRLVAYVVPHAGAEVTVSELRRFVTERLPEYMAPAAMIEMDSLPLNANGKVDRSKLPDPEQVRPELGLQYIAPTTDTEVLLCEVWATVLGLDRVGIRDNFFDLGGDSIRSIQTMSRSEAAGCVFSIQELFQNPTIESLAVIADSRNGTRTPKRAIQPFSLAKEEDRAALAESVEDAYPLTMLQAGMIFHSELNPSTAVYHDIFSFHLRTPFDPDLMQQSLDAVIARHPVLRTSFNLTGLSQPLQLVHRAADLKLQVEDISLLDGERQQRLISDLVSSERETGFRWDRPPLLRLWLHKRSEESFQFTLSFHHAILDGWSLATLFAELFDLYLAKLNGHEEVPRTQSSSSFSDYVGLEIEAVQSEEFRQFWTELLTDAPFTSIPRSEFCSQLTHEPSGEISICALRIPEEATDGLKQLSRKLGVPLKSILLGTHAKVLALLSGRNDIVTGTISNGRLEERGAENVLGLFLNSLPLRIRFETSAIWQELALAAFEAEKKTLQYRRYPLAEMQRVTDRNPLFEAAFNYTHFHAVSGVLGEQGIEVLEDETVSETNFPFLVDFNLDPASSQLDAALKYDSGLFDGREMELIAGYYQRALGLMAKSPEAANASALLLSESEIDLLVHGWNSTAVDYAARSSVADLVAQQAAARPDAVALISGESHFSYGTVDRRANRLASCLVRLGAGPERRIGVALDRTESLCIALLAVLKSGSAYVPLDPEFPSERLGQMLPAVEILLSERGFTDRFETVTPSGPQLLRLDELEDAISMESGEQSPSRVQPDSLVYAIFTSGSTGTPKAVAITQRVATNMVQWNASMLPRERRVLQFASPSFDVAFQEVFSTWASGGTLVMVSDSDRRDAAVLASVITENEVERLFLPGVALQQLVEQVLKNGPVPAVTEVITAGEQLKVTRELRRFFDTNERRSLHNHYGPSETHVATAFQLEGSPQLWTDLPPIGAPIANAKIYLLNENLEMAPAGVPAEIFIGGDVVGRGYLSRPDLTAQNYVCDPFSSSGSRLYRTGDLGRRRADGRIDFLGRLDHQVKVRGYRVELGEVESALASHPFVRQAAVAAFDVNGSKKLVAYVAPDRNGDVDITELTAFLKTHLPDYMLPAEYVRLDKLPTTATGKVDRRALRLPVQGARASKTEFVPPATPTEELVARIWSEVLDKREIGTRENFFELGGHSLLANQIVSRIRDALGSNIPLKVLFEHPTIAGFSAYIDSGTSARALAVEPILPRDASSSSPLSIAQRRLWFLEQLDPHQGAYHIALSLRLVGDLNLEALDQALAEIVSRHEVLRSRIFTVDGVPFQAVESIKPVLSLLDTAAVEKGRRLIAVRALISSLHSRIFDFAEAPLMRICLVKVANDEHILTVTMHHLISDGWSMGIFSDELASLYKSFSAGAEAALTRLPIQYRDFASWQNGWSKTERFQSELSYWKEQLGGQLAAIDLPSDHTRPLSRTFDGETACYKLDSESRRELKRVADDEGVTLFMAYLSSFFSLLYRYTGQSDLIVGVPSSGRNRPEIERLMGFFVNTLAFRVALSGALTFRDTVLLVKEVSLLAYANQDVPFEMLVEELQPDRNPARSPIFDLMFDLQAETAVGRSADGLQILPFQHDSSTSKFDLTIAVMDSASEPSATVEFSTDLFERCSIDRLISHFNILLRSAVETPNRAISELGLMSPREVRQILEEFNDTTRHFPDQSCIHQLFDRAAERGPDAVALVSKEENVTYGVLCHRSNMFAGLLIERGVTTESRVGVCLSRSGDLILSLLAVLKAGGAYVPMDASYPPSRLQFMAADAEVSLLLTSSEVLGRIPASSESVICVDKLAWTDQSVDPGQTYSRAFPESLAYVIYTSGTTGSPKGVAVSHKAVVRLVKNANYVEIDDRQVFLQLSTVSFDVATFEIWACLLNGAKLVLMPDEMASLEDIERAVASHGITTMWLTAGLFHLMVDRKPEALYSIGQLLAGGEALQADHVNRYVTGAGPGRLINGYGPTEVTTFTCCHRFDRPVEESRPVPIGRPISNTRAYILDDWLGTTPVAVKGQIYASGPGLARGYLNNADLTAERFLPNPFGVGSGDRMYSTGDIGRYLNDGAIEFIGRVDGQIKLRGFRIELGEVESILASLPEVSRAVVVVRTDKTDDRRLVAYVVAKLGATVAPDHLRERAKDALPDFMVPSSFVVLDTLPLTRSGKVDHRALPIPDPDATLDSGEFEPPRNGIEEGLVRIWMAVLGRDRIGIRDDFFDLGGHSLLATQVVSRIREAFQVELPLRSLFENKNIERLGGVVETLLLDRLDEMSEEEAAELLG